MDITAAVTEFANRLQTVIEEHSMARARAAVLSAFGMKPKRGPGRPPKGVKALAPIAKKARRKGPLQLCPVPGCKNPAAPIFGMVCAKHKDTPKATIKKFREARRAKKLGLPAPKAGKRRVARKASARKVKVKKASKKAAKPAAATPSTGTAAAAA